MVFTVIACSTALASNGAFTSTAVLVQCSRRGLAVPGGNPASGAARGRVDARVNAPWAARRSCKFLSFSLRREYICCAFGEDDTVGTNRLFWYIIHLFATFSLADASVRRVKQKLNVSSQILRTATARATKPRRLCRCSSFQSDSGNICRGSSFLQMFLDE